MSTTTLRCVNADSSQWMMSSAGQSPCEVLESVLRVCDASASVPNLSVDVSCGSLGNSTSPCCCSTATYALVSACWVCQTGQLPSLLSNTYQTWWSSCPISSRLNGSLPTVVTRQIVVPRWALITPEWTDTNWNQSSAQLAVGIKPTSTLSNSIAPTPTPSSSLSPSPSPPRHNRTPPYAPIAVCSVLGLVLLLGMTAWLYRRRNRVSPSSRPPHDFDIDQTSSGLIPKHETARPKWLWWKKSGSDRHRYESDPGKIDAWRYPFEYEPVSIGSAGSTASGRGIGIGFYDPYRPQPSHQPHHSDLHLAPRSSMDTLAARNSNSRNRTPTSGSTQNLRATPSPVPGTTTPVQTYAGLPQPQGASSYGYGQPPTYGQAIPYTYPYAQPQPQAVSSSSAGSPMSRRYNHMQSPTQILYSHSHSHSHSHPAPGPSRRADQVLMIPIDQMSPEQIEQLRLQFPDLRIKQKKRRRRRHGDPETDREHDRDRDRGRARAGTDAAQPHARARPRSWSVPAQAQVAIETGEDEEQWDGRPRNGVELREKYERWRASREVVVVSMGVGASGVREEERRDERRNSRVRGPQEREREKEGDRGRERTRARDGGVSLMGGPPPRR